MIQEYSSTTDLDLNFYFQLKVTGYFKFLRVLSNISNVCKLEMVFIFKVKKIQLLFNMELSFFLVFFSNFQLFCFIPRWTLFVVLKATGLLVSSLFIFRNESECLLPVFPDSIMNFILSGLDHSNQLVYC